VAIEHPGVVSDHDDDRAWATGVVDASPHEVFEFLRRPANHRTINGDRSVRGTVNDGSPLELGSTFGMKMSLFVPYRITSKVVEFEQDRLIAWAHIGGHRWRWELAPARDDRATVTETFDLTTARFPSGLRLLGYPGRHAGNVASSVAALRAHFEH